MKRNNMTSNAASLPACTLGCRAAIARTLFPLALAASLVGAASAEVVFEQSPVDGNDAFASISAEQSADGFRLSATTAVTGLTWWGSYSQDPTTLPADAFSVRIFADDGSGAPEAAPTETISQQPIRSSTSLSDQTGAPVYRFDLALTPLTLAGATNWYLSVVNQFDVGDPDAGWYWLLSNPTDKAVVQPAPRWFVFPLALTRPAEATTAAAPVTTGAGAACFDTAQLPAGPRGP